MKQITLRNVDPELADALGREQRERHKSLNQVVLDLLRRALGLSGAERFSNGLRRHAGTWSDDDLREFERSTAEFGRIDSEDWR